MALDSTNPKSIFERGLDDWWAERQADKAAHIEAENYAGANLMAHHEGGNPRGGMLGGADILVSMHSPERIKFLAGRELVSARLNRRLGYLAAARKHLRRAVALRQSAAEMVSA